MYKKKYSLLTLEPFPDLLLELLLDFVTFLFMNVVLDLNQSFLIPLLILPLENTPVLFDLPELILIFVRILRRGNLQCNKQDKL